MARARVEGGNSRSEGFGYFAGFRSIGIGTFRLLQFRVLPLVIFKIREFNMHSTVVSLIQIAYMVTWYVRAGFDRFMAR